MQSDKLDMYLMSNAKFFPAGKMPLLKESLARIPDEQFVMLHSVDLKDPTTILLVSIFLGEFGVDRFLLGDTGLGVGKLLTLGGCLIWWFIDIFLVQERAREVNFEKMMAMANQIAPASAYGYGNFQQ